LLVPFHLLLLLLVLVLVLLLLPVLILTGTRRKPIRDKTCCCCFCYSGDCTSSSRRINSGGLAPFSLLVEDGVYCHVASAVPDGKMSGSAASRWLQGRRRRRGRKLRFGRSLW